MLDIKITTDFKDPGELPVTLPCPNKKCDGKVSFKLGDVKAKKTVKCLSCGINVHLNEAES